MIEQGLNESQSVVSASPPKVRHWPAMKEKQEMEGLGGTSLLELFEN